MSPRVPRAGARASDRRCVNVGGVVVRFEEKEEDREDREGNVGHWASSLSRRRRLDGCPGVIEEGHARRRDPPSSSFASARALFLFTSPSLASARSSAFSALLPSSPDERNIRPGQHAPLRHANDTLPSSSFERPFSFRRLRMVRFTRTQRTAARFPFQ